MRMSLEMYDDVWPGYCMESSGSWSEAAHGRCHCGKKYVRLWRTIREKRAHTLRQLGRVDDGGFRLPPVLLGRIL